MQWSVTVVREVFCYVLVLLLAGALCVPDEVWAEEPDPLVIPVTASDSTFEEGVLVTWPQAGTDSVFYGVYRDSVLQSLMPGSAASYFDTSAAVRTTYEYCVHMYDFRTDTEMDLGCDTGSRAFLKPYRVTASDGSFTDRVRITWIDRSRIETGYEIWREEPDSTWILAGTTVANRGTFDDAGVTPGITYTYCVNAIRGSDVSMQDCDTGLCSYLLAPASFEVSDGQYTDKVVLTWEDRSDNETAFEITRDAAVIDSVPADSTSYEDLTGLGIEHTYCVRAVDDTTASPQVCDEGIGGDSTMVTPGDVEATYDEFDDRVEITWEDSTDTEDGFDIYRGGSLIASVYENTTAYTDSDAPPGVANSYAVVATSDHGGSSRSASAMGRRSLIIPPTDVSASDGGFEAYAEISWESASTTVVLFGIARDGVPVKNVAGGDRSVRDYDIAPGVDYAYCVWGVTAMGDTSLHMCDMGRRELKPPTFVSASDDTLEDRVAITWTDVSKAETGYRIYRRYPHPDSTAVEIGTTPANRGLFEDEACVPGITYEYSVVAYDARGESDAQTDTGSRILLAPTSVEATDGEFEDRIEITWQGTSFAESGYRIYRKYPDPDSVAVLVGTTDEYVTEFIDLSPEFTVNYTYYVAAYDAWGESDRDWDTGFTTLLSPSWVNASDFYDDRVVITWVDESSIETGYQILRNGVLIDSTGADVTTFADSPPQQDVTYVYCVRSANGMAQSDEACDTGMRPSPLPEPELPVVEVMPQYAYGYFGEAVAIDGDIMIVGAPGYTGGKGDAYIFERDGADWVEVYRHGESGLDSSRFGWSVAISGDIALVGNPEHDSFRGAVHVISRDEYGTWTESAILTAGGGVSGDEFGYSVAIDGGLAIVGAPMRTSATGAAYILSHDGAAWAEDAQLTASDGSAGDRFGHSVAIDSRLAVVGAPLHASKGAAYIYSYSGGVWTEVYTCEPLDLEPDAYVGGSVAIDGDFAVIGAPTIAGSAGAAYIYRRYVDTWELTDEIEPPWDALPSPCLGVGSCDIPDYARGVAVSGDYAYVADGWSGLQVIDISDPTTPTIVGTCDTPDWAQAVAVSGDYAYVADGSSGLQVIDISNPASPTLGGSYDTPGAAFGVAISGNYAYVADGTSGLKVIDISNPASPDSVGSYDTPGAAFGVAISGDYAYVADGSSGLQVIDISNPASPDSVGTCDTPGQAQGVAVSGNYAYVADEALGLQVIDISNPASPTLVGNYDPYYYAWGVAVLGDYAYVATEYSGLHVIDISNPASPTLASTYDTWYARGVAVRGHHVYVADGSSGLQVVAFLPPEGFGKCVAIDRDVLVASAPCAHAAYAYARDGDIWKEMTRLPTAAGGADVDNSHFAVGDRAVLSVDIYYKKTPAPTAVTASAGDFDDRVRIEWQDDSPLRSPYEGAFRIYRDGRIIEALGPTARSYNDFSAEPGRTYEYGLAGYWEALGESDAVFVYGRRPADGAVSGRVTSRGGAGLESMMVYLDPPPNSALLFDGAASYVEVENPVVPGDSLTVEFWVRSTDSGRDGWVMCYAAGSDPSQALLGIGDISNLRVRVKDAETDSTGVGVDDGRWHHVAVTWRSSDGRLEIFKDGESAYDTTGIATGEAIPGEGTLVFGQNPWEGFNEHYALAGQLDEVRIWEGVRTRDEIASLMKQPLSGGENGLVAYWPFDEGTGRYATADLTGNNAYGALEGALHWTSGTDSLEVSTFTDLEGSYAITGIRYGASSTLKVIPFKESRTFEPGFRMLILDPESPVGNDVSFTDVSSFTVAGRVYFEGTGCALENAEIWVDGELKGTSDKEGNFKVAVDPGVHIIEPVFTDHTFAPASRETLILGDTHGLNFEDTLVRRLSGGVGGGCGLSFGTLDIEIWARGGCFDTTLHDVAGNYEVLLPPLKYFASVESVHVAAGSGLDVVDLERFFEDLGVREIDLADSAAQLDFTYWAPLAVEIEGLPEVLCDEIVDEERGTVVPAVPVIAQGEGVELTIRVVSDYGDSGTCLVDTGTVTIFDEIMDIADQPTTLNLENGVATYTTYGRYPNIFYGRTDADGNDRSYQKALTVVAYVEGRGPVRETRWVMVTGDLPRTGTFVSATTEEFPLLVLRDPPGDGSCSFVERGRTVTTRFSRVVLSDTTNLGGWTAKAGLDVRVAIGQSYGTAFYYVTWSIAPLFQVCQETVDGWEWGVRATEEGAMELSLTTTERFSTSSSDLFVGPEGDVYLGVAMNLIFAKADVLGIDRSGEPCRVVKSETVRFGVDGEEPFETIYLYTQDHIENTLIPQYESLAEIEPDRAAEFEGYIANWQSHLDRNDSLRTLALESPRENRSFSAGATQEFRETKDSTATYVTAFEVFSSDEEARTFGFYTAGYGRSSIKKNEITASCTTYTEATDTTDVLEVGCLLTDDDPGDYFSTDIAFDSEYGTPVFGLKSGRSSCPWEQGTQPRDSLFMTIEPDSLEGVPPEEPAVFTLWLSNASVSEETREYVLHPVQTSNPGGAILRVNGEPFHDGLSFTILADQTQEATLTVERGPSKYYYRDLKLVLMSACDESIADTVTFSVAYDAPCSDITLYSPQPGWAFNLGNAEASSDSMDLILTDFEMRVSQYDSLMLVGAEYRPDGTDDEPYTIGLIARENITLNPDGTPQSQHIPWDLSGVDDGRYEVRAYTQCSSGGPVSSSFATGTIDRARPTPFGAPQPTDGELALGDEVSVTFNEPIRCSSVNPLNITLECVNPDSGSPEVGFEVTCNGSRVVITPDITGLSPLEGKTVRATITGVKDLFGNPMVARDSTSTEAWEFEVRQSAFVWSETDIIHEAAYRYGGSFAAELVNGMPEDVNFSITGVPGWLTPSVTSGCLFSGESDEIAFAIPDTLSMGTYQDTLYAEVEGAVPEIVAPLHVTVEVACQRPLWALDPARFEHSMNIVADLEIEGQASQDTSDMLAAYVGTELRGVASPVYHPDPAYEYLVYLTVFSNRTGGETIRFQVWDEDSCRLYTNTDRFFTFVADGHIGDPENPELMVASDTLPGLAQVVELGDGWTWLSLNLTDLDMSVNGVLADLNAAADDVIKSQTEFSTFDPDLGWVGSLTDLDNVSSYAISLSQVGTLIHEGSAVDPDTLPMPGSAGWHWIGYLPQDELDVGDALVNLSAPHDLVKSQQEFAQVNVLGEWVGSLETMEPGEGYRLWLSDDRGAWYYPGGSAGIPTAMSPDPGHNSGDGAVWSVDAHAYEHNMSMIAALELDGKTVSDDGYLIGAFVDGEVRGVAPLEYVPQLGRHLAFLMIHSNEIEGEPVTFQAYDETNHEEVALNETVTFAADHTWGSLRSPFVLTGSLGNTTGLPVAFSLAQNSPNPLAPSGKGVIRYGLPRSAHVVLKVYDVRGREVKTLVDREQPAGWQYVEVDAADFAAGIYFYRINAGGFVSQRKMTVLR
jgi:hypothetical protein